MIAMSKPSIALPVQDKLHVTETGKGVKVRADQPHLVSLGGGRLSTAVTLLPLEEGTTTLGSGDDQDIVVRGTGVHAAHCCIQYDDGILILTPNDATCLVTVDGSKAEGPTILSQGCMICIGRSNYFRFNHPEQAAQLKNILPANTRVSVVPLQFTSSYLKGRPRQAIGQSAAGSEHLLPESHEEEDPELAAEEEQEEEDADDEDGAADGAGRPAVTTALATGTASALGGGAAVAAPAASAVHVVTSEGAATEAGAAAAAAVADDRRYRDRLAEESFSNKLKRFERLSASLPASVQPSAGGSSSSMGPPAGKGGGGGSGGGGAGSSVSSSKGSHQQPVGYWGHVGEKVFTKHTVTTTVPLADLTGDLPFGGSGSTSSLGRHRSASGGSSSGGGGGSSSSNATAGLAGWPQATVPASAVAPAAASAANRAADDGSAASWSARNPSDPLPSMRAANTVSKYDEVFAEDLPPEPRHHINGGIAVPAFSDVVMIGVDGGASAEASLALQHRRMVEERKLAEEAEEREQRRLEEILLLCAEYERQAECELQATDPAATGGIAAAPANEPPGPGSTAACSSGARNGGAGDGSGLPRHHGVHRLDGHPVSAALGSSVPLLQTAVGSCSSAHPSHGQAEQDHSPGGGSSGSGSSSRSGPAANTVVVSEATVHDSDSGVGSSASLAGRDGRFADSFELHTAARTAAAAPCSGSSGCDDDHYSSIHGEGAARSELHGPGGDAAGTHPHEHSTLDGAGSLFAVQTTEKLGEDEERIYDDPAMLVVPPPLPPRNSKQPATTTSAEERGAGSSGRSGPVEGVGSLRRDTSGSAAMTCGSLHPEAGLSSLSSGLLQRALPPPPGAPPSGVTEGAAAVATAADSVSRERTVAMMHAPDSFAAQHGGFSPATLEMREALLADCSLPSMAAAGWRVPHIEGSPMRRLPLASATGHGEQDEAKSQLRKLRKCQSETMHALSALKRHILELERQQADAVNELDAEWSALESEQKYELDQLNVQLQTNAHVKAKKLASLDRAAAQREQESSKIELSKRRLHELESRRMFIEKELRNLPEGLKGQQMFSLYVGELEAIDNQKKLLEDLDFKQMEVDVRYDEERESMQRELSRQQAELQQTICSAEERLDGIAWRQRELLRTTRGEVEDIERLRKGLVADFRKEKQRLVELEERAAELEHIAAGGSGAADDEQLHAAARFAEGTGGSSASLASLISSRDGSFSGQMWSSPSNTMDRSVLAKLKAADALVKEEQRKLRELKLASFKNAATASAAAAEPPHGGRKRSEGRKRSPPATAVQQQRDVSSGFSPGLVSRADSMDEGTSLKGSEATLSDGDMLSSGSADEVERYLELQKLLAQARAHVQNVSDSDRSLSAERKLRKDLERQLADEKEKRQQIVEEEVQLRERRRLVALSALERPLTRYLPVRAKEFDLRQHVELAGHNVDACPFVELDSRTCRGFLLKMGSKSRSWNKRWFSFDRDKKALLYYGDRNDSRPRGVIYFQTIEDVFVDHMHTVKSPYHKLTFCVKTYERPYYLIAKTPETMSLWIDVIFSGAEGYLEF